MKMLYFDCFSGLSGDMTVGALLDAGGDFGHLKEQLRKLNIEDEYELTKKTVNKNGITATKFDVLLKGVESKNSEAGHVHSHHNDHAHAHREGDGEHEHRDADSDDHTHDDSHQHGHSHDHHHRLYFDIVQMISAAQLNENIKKMALNIFKKIGEAEGKIHGMPLDHVHFHEVGAVDSIIDIVGTAILIDELAIDKIYCAPVPTGSGTIHIDHGVYPVPAPATLEILKGIPLAESVLKAELTTPTGAAIAAVLAESFSAFPALKVTEIGYGAGTKTFPKHPNVLRAVIGEY